jgi:hypothetical protein
MPRCSAAFPFPYVVRCHAVIFRPDGGPASVLGYMDSRFLYAVLH